MVIVESDSENSSPRSARPDHDSNFSAKRRRLGLPKAKGKVKAASQAKGMFRLEKGKPPGDVAKASAHFRPDHKSRFQPKKKIKKPEGSSGSARSASSSSEPGGPSSSDSSESSDDSNTSSGPDGVSATSSNSSLGHSNSAAKRRRLEQKGGSSSSSCPPPVSSPLRDLLPACSGSDSESDSDDGDKKDPIRGDVERHENVRKYFDTDAKLGNREICAVDGCLQKATRRALRVFNPGKDIMISCQFDGSSTRGLGSRNEFGPNGGRDLGVGGGSKKIQRLTENRKKLCFAAEAVLVSRDDSDSDSEVVLGSNFGEQSSTSNLYSSNDGARLRDEIRIPLCTRTIDVSKEIDEDEGGNAREETESFQFAYASVAEVSYYIPKTSPGDDDQLCLVQMVSDAGGSSVCAQHYADNMLTKEIPARRGESVLEVKPPPLYMANSNSMNATKGPNHMMSGTDREKKGPNSKKYVKPVNSAHVLSFCKKHPDSSAFTGSLAATFACLPLSLSEYVTGLRRLSTFVSRNRLKLSKTVCKHTEQFAPSLEYLPVVDLLRKICVAKTVRTATCVRTYEHRSKELYTMLLSLVRIKQMERAATCHGDDYFGEQARCRTPVWLDLGFEEDASSGANLRRQVVKPSPNASRDHVSNALNPVSHSSSPPRMPTIVEEESGKEAGPEYELKPSADSRNNDNRNENGNFQLESNPFDDDDSQDEGDMPDYAYLDSLTAKEAKDFAIPILRQYGTVKVPSLTRWASIGTASKDLLGSVLCGFGWFTNHHADGNLYVRAKHFRHMVSSMLVTSLVSLPSDIVQFFLQRSDIVGDAELLSEKLEAGMSIALSMVSSIPTIQEPPVPSHAEGKKPAFKKPDAKNKEKPDTKKPSPPARYKKVGASNSSSSSSSASKANSSEGSTKNGAPASAFEKEKRPQQTSASVLQVATMVGLLTYYSMAQRQIAYSTPEELWLEKLCKCKEEDEYQDLLDALVHADLRRVQMKASGIKSLRRLFASRDRQDRPGVAKRVCRLYQRMRATTQRVESKHAVIQQAKGCSAENMSCRASRSFVKGWIKGWRRRFAILKKTRRLASGIVFQNQRDYNYHDLQKMGIANCVTSNDPRVKAKTQARKQQNQEAIEQARRDLQSHNHEKIASANEVISFLLKETAREYNEREYGLKTGQRRFSEKVYDCKGRKLLTLKASRGQYQLVEPFADTFDPLTLACQSYKVHHNAVARIKQKLHATETAEKVKSVKETIFKQKATKKPAMSKQKQPRHYGGRDDSGSSDEEIVVGNAQKSELDKIRPPTGGEGFLILNVEFGGAKPECYLCLSIWATSGNPSFSALKCEVVKGIDDASSYYAVQYQPWCPVLLQTPVKPSVVAFSMSTHSLIGLENDSIRFSYRGAKFDPEKHKFNPKNVATETKNKKAMEEMGKVSIWKKRPAGMVDSSGSECVSDGDSKTLREKKKTHHNKKPTLEERRQEVGELNAAKKHQAVGVFSIRSEPQRHYVQPLSKKEIIKAGKPELLKLHALYWRLGEPGDELMQRQPATGRFQKGIKTNRDWAEAECVLWAARNHWILRRYDKTEREKTPAEIEDIVTTLRSSKIVQSAVAFAKRYRLGADKVEKRLRMTNGDAKFVRAPAIDDSESEPPSGWQSGSEDSSEEDDDLLARSGEDDCKPRRGGGVRESTIPNGSDDGDSNLDTDTDGISNHVDEVASELERDD